MEKENRPLIASRQGRNYAEISLGVKKTNKRIGKERMTKYHIKPRRETGRD